MLVPSIFALLILVVLFQFLLLYAMCASWYLGFEMHDVHILCQGSSVGQKGICSVFCLLVFRIVHHVLHKARLAIVLHTVHSTRDLVDDACIPSHIAVPKPAPKPAPTPAPKPPAKGDAQGKKKKHVQQFKMRYSLTKKGFISEPVDP